MMWKVGLYGSAGKAGTWLEFMAEKYEEKGGWFKFSTGGREVGRVRAADVAVIQQVNPPL